MSFSLLLPACTLVGVNAFVWIGIGVVVVALALPRPASRCIVGLFSQVINVYLQRRYPIRSIDRRRDLPSLPYVWPNGQGDAGKFLNGVENSALWAKRHGSVYRIWAGTTPEVVLTCPSQLKSVFKDSDKHVKALNNDSGYLMSQILGQCVGLISPPAWQKVRAIAEVPFRHRAISSQIELIRRHVESHFAQLFQHSEPCRGLIHPVQDLKMLPFWITCELLYGALGPELLLRLQDLAPRRERLMGHVVRGGLSRFAFSRWLPSEANRTLRGFREEWTRLNQDIVAFCRTRDPASVVLTMWSQVEKGQITEQHLLQTLDEILYANLDVTIGALSWNLVFLAANPERQERLRGEAEGVAGFSSLNEYLLSPSTFLHACMLESSRLKPLAAFSVPQAAPTDRLVDNFVIPAHTNVVVDAYSLNIASEYWGPDNRSFRPERFLDAKGKDLRYLFWRYGFGPRQCMGKHAADVMIRTVLHHLVTHYRLSMLESTDFQWGRDADTWITHPTVQLRCEQRPTTGSADESRTTVIESADTDMS